MSKVVSLRLKEDQVQRLERAARRMGKAPSSAAVVLLEEALRLRDFPLLEFRDSAVGREAYVKGTRLQVWMVKWLLRHYDGKIEAMADSLGVRPSRLSEALRYAETYPDEIDEAIADQNRVAENPARYIPGLKMAPVGRDEDPA